ncbi:MAG: hypothetical protein ABW215_17440, partial [Kibdelosporangium sp.]
PLPAGDEWARLYAGIGAARNRLTKRELRLFDVMAEELWTEHTDELDPQDSGDARARVSKGLLDFSARFDHILKYVRHWDLQRTERIRTTLLVDRFALPRPEVQPNSTSQWSRSESALRLYDQVANYLLAMLSGNPTDAVDDVAAMIEGLGANESRVPGLRELLSWHDPDPDRIGALDPTNDVAVSAERELPPPVSAVAAPTDRFTDRGSSAKLPLVVAGLRDVLAPWRGPVSTQAAAVASNVLGERPEQDEPWVQAYDQMAWAVIRTPGMAASRVLAAELWTLIGPHVPVEPADVADDRPWAAALQWQAEQLLELPDDEVAGWRAWVATRSGLHPGPATDPELAVAVDAMAYLASEGWDHDAPNALVREFAAALHATRLVEYWTGSETGLAERLNRLFIAMSQARSPLAVQGTAPWAWVLETAPVPTPHQAVRQAADIVGERPVHGRDEISLYSRMMRAVAHAGHVAAVKAGKEVQRRFRPEEPDGDSPAAALRELLGSAERFDGLAADVAVEWRDRTRRHARVHSLRLSAAARAYESELAEQMRLQGKEVRSKPTLTQDGMTPPVRRAVEAFAYLAYVGRDESDPWVHVRRFARPMWQAGLAPAWVEATHWSADTPVRDTETTLRTLFEALAWSGTGDRSAVLAEAEATAEDAQLAAKTAANAAGALAARNLAVQMWTTIGPALVAEGSTWTPAGLWRTTIAQYANDLAELTAEDRKLSLTLALPWALPEPGMSTARQERARPVHHMLLDALARMAHADQHLADRWSRVRPFAAAVRQLIENGVLSGPDFGRDAAADDQVHVELDALFDTAASQGSVPGARPEYDMATPAGLADRALDADRELATLAQDERRLLLDRTDALLAEPDWQHLRTSSAPPLAAGRIRLVVAHQILRSARRQAKQVDSPDLDLHFAEDVVAGISRALRGPAAGRPHDGASGPVHEKFPFGTMVNQDNYRRGLRGEPGHAGYTRNCPPAVVQFFNALAFGRLSVESNDFPFAAPPVDGELLDGFQLFGLAKSDYARLRDLDQIKARLRGRPWGTFGVVHGVQPAEPMHSLAVYRHHDDGEIVFYDPQVGREVLVAPPEFTGFFFAETPDPARLASDLSQPGVAAPVALPSRSAESPEDAAGVPSAATPDPGSVPEAAGDPRARWVLGPAARLSDISARFETVHGERMRSSLAFMGSLDPVVAGASWAVAVVLLGRPVAAPTLGLAEDERLSVQQQREWYVGVLAVVAEAAAKQATSAVQEGPNVSDELAALADSAVVEPVLSATADLRRHLDVAFRWTALGVLPGSELSGFTPSIALARERHRTAGSGVVDLWGVPGRFAPASGDPAVGDVAWLPWRASGNVGVDGLLQRAGDALRYWPSPPPVMDLASWLRIGLLDDVPVALYVDDAHTAQALRWLGPRPGNEQPLWQQVYDRLVTAVAGEARSRGDQAARDLLVRTWTLIGPVVALLESAQSQSQRPWLAAVMWHAGKMRGRPQRTAEESRLLATRLMVPSKAVPADQLRQQQNRVDLWLDALANQVVLDQQSADPIAHAAQFAVAARPIVMASGWMDTVGTSLTTNANDWRPSARTVLRDMFRVALAAGRAPVSSGHDVLELGEMVNRGNYLRGLRLEQGYVGYSRNCPVAVVQFFNAIAFMRPFAAPPVDGALLDGFQVFGLSKVDYVAVDGLDGALDRIKRENWPRGTFGVLQAVRPERAMHSFAAYVGHDDGRILFYDPQAGRELHVETTVFDKLLLARVPVPARSADPSGPGVAEPVELPTREAPNLEDAAAGLSAPAIGRSSLPALLTVLGQSRVAGADEVAHEVRTALEDGLREGQDDVAAAAALARDWADVAEQAQSLLRDLDEDTYAQQREEADILLGPVPGPVTGRAAILTAALRARLADVLTVELVGGLPQEHTFTARIAGMRAALSEYHNQFVSPSPSQQAIDAFLEQHPWWTGQPDPDVGDWRERALGLAGGLPDGARSREVLAYENMVARLAFRLRTWDGVHRHAVNRAGILAANLGQAFTELTPAESVIELVATGARLLAERVHAQRRYGRPDGRGELTDDTYAAIALAAGRLAGPGGLSDEDSVVTLDHMALALTEQPPVASAEEMRTRLLKLFDELAIPQADAVTAAFGRPAGLALRAIVHGAGYLNPWDTPDSVFLAALVGLLHAKGESDQPVRNEVTIAFDALASQDDDTVRQWRAAGYRRLRSEYPRVFAADALGSMPARQLAWSDTIAAMVGHRSANHPLRTVFADVAEWRQAFDALRHHFDQPAYVVDARREAESGESESDADMSSESDAGGAEHGDQLIAPDLRLAEFYHNHRRQIATNTSRLDRLDPAIGDTAKTLATVMLGRRLPVLAGGLSVRQSERLHRDLVNVVAGELAVAATDTVNVPTFNDLISPVWVDHVWNQTLDLRRAADALVNGTRFGRLDAPDTAGFWVPVEQARSRHASASSPEGLFSALDRFEAFWDNRFLVASSVLMKGISWHPFSGFQARAELTDGYLDSARTVLGMPELSPTGHEGLDDLLYVFGAAWQAHSFMFIGHSSDPDTSAFAGDARKRWGLLQELYSREVQPDDLDEAIRATRDELNQDHADLYAEAMESLQWLETARYAGRMLAVPEPPARGTADQSPPGPGSWRTSRLAHQLYDKALALVAYEITRSNPDAEHVAAQLRAGVQVEASDEDYPVPGLSDLLNWYDGDLLDPAQLGEIDSALDRGEPAPLYPDDG